MLTHRVIRSPWSKSHHHKQFKQILSECLRNINGYQNMCSCALTNRYIWLVFNIVKVGWFLTLEQSITQVCDLVTCVLNWCQIILSAWLALRWPYAVDGMLKINSRTSWLICCTCAGIREDSKFPSQHDSLPQEGPPWKVALQTRSLRGAADCSGWPGVVHNHSK